MILHPTFLAPAGRQVRSGKHINLFKGTTDSYSATLVQQDFVEPIYFYIGVVFCLQALYVTALFVCSWVLSGTWVAGMLAVSWYVINR